MGKKKQWSRCIARKKPPVPAYKLENLKKAQAKKAEKLAERLDKKDKERQAEELAQALQNHEGNRKRKTNPSEYHPAKRSSVLEKEAGTSQMTASQIYFQKIKQIETDNPSQNENGTDKTLESAEESLFTETPATSVQPLVPKRREIFSIPSIVAAVKKIGDHVKTCDKGEILFDSLYNVSMYSSLNFKCVCGWEVSMLSDDSCHNFQINHAVSLASVSVPVGFDDARSLFTTLEISPPTLFTFKRHRSMIENQMKITLERSMKEAVLEEQKLAEAAGNYVMIKGKRYFFITVVVDGSWAKRSYGHSYNSNYGCAAIIGAATGKVLYYDVRIKTCFSCSRAKRLGTKVPHANCYMNWSGPSTAMEADIIYEGFSKSIESQGLVYKYMIGDGDSNTYSRVKDVYNDVTVEKIECINHVIRNLNSKLRNIGSNVVKKKNVQISKDERSIPRMESRFRRIGLAVQAACTYYKTLGNWDEDWPKLREDIKNIPYHIFGRHTNCSTYFKCSMAEEEQDIVDTVKDKPLFQELVSALDRVAGLSKSLIRRQNSNIVECFMAVVARYLEGKRKNLGGRSLYSLKVGAAVLSFNNCKFWANDFFKTTHLRSPNTPWRRERQRQLNLRAASRNRKKVHKPRVLTFGFLKERRGDKHYGSDPERPDISDEQLKLEMNSIRDQVTVDEKRRNEIEMATKNQSDCDLWREERRKRITASWAKDIARKQDSTDNEVSLRNLLSNSTATTAAMQYGKTHEQDAIAEYERIALLTPGTVQKSGLFVSLEDGCLAASPDGLIGNDGILEVKCPPTFENCSLETWAKRKNSPIEGTLGNFTFKRDHAHYYQVVMQLHVTGRSWCDYFVWSQTGQYFLQRVTRAESLLFWESFKQKLIRFWEEDLLPELADSRLAKNQKPRLPEYRRLAQAKKVEKARIKSSGRMKIDSSPKSTQRYKKAKNKKSTR